MLKQSGIGNGFLPNIRSFSNGSSISFCEAKCLMSEPIFWTVAPKAASALATRRSTLRVYVWVDIYYRINMVIFLIIWGAK
jgi:hypothetical protein